MDLSMSHTITHPLTSRTYVSLAIARGIAAANGHTDLTGVHIALGILREAENPAVAALHHGGVTLSGLRRDLEAALPPRGHPRGGEFALPATPGEREIMDVALGEARSRNVEYVANEHLLLALLRDPDSVVGQVFSRHGVAYDTAANHLRLVLAGVQ
jgi:ATP-dependent Clp protease ATP-binding subunit ClpC